MALVQIINTGVANIRSLQATLERLGHSWHLTEDPGAIADSEFVVLPGVGAFAAATERLDELGLRDALVQRISADRPTLAICLGMQLLCRASEESPDAQGLGIVDSTIQRFDDSVQVPQLGWNDVVPRQSGPLSEGQAYFANSFRMTKPPKGWGWAETEYGGTFVSSIWRGRVLACQFHPELSGDWGQQVVSNWIKDVTC